MRIAIAPPTVRVEGNRPPPPVRVDLSNWLQDWHGLSVASTPDVDHFDLYPEQGSFKSRSNAKRIYDVCEAGRSAGLDAVVFTRFVEDFHSNVTCGDLFNFDEDYSNCKHPTVRPGSERYTTLTFRVLYPLHCILSEDFNVNDKYLAATKAEAELRKRPSYTRWEEYRELILSVLPDYLRTEHSQFRVTEQAFEICPAAALAECLAPLQPTPAALMPTPTPNEPAGTAP
jgi:hypothetical protein